jgi:hypothetical protein
VHLDVDAVPEAHRVLRLALQQPPQHGDVEDETAPVTKHDARLLAIGGQHHHRAPLA